MKRVQIILVAAAACLLSACHEEKASEGGRKATTAQVAPKKAAAKQKKEVPQTVTIFRYEGFPMRMAEALRDELKKTFPVVRISPQVLALPPQAFVRERNRYKGIVLLDDLKKRKGGDAVIGLTDRVICHPNEISPTFGVMGLSPIGTYTSVVSSQIPRNGRTHSLDNFVKLALHELGHAYGLSHSPDQHCYMVDAEHKMKFPQTTGFCSRCRAKLHADGWKLK